MRILLLVDAGPHEWLFKYRESGYGKESQPTLSVLEVNQLTVEQTDLDQQVASDQEGGAPEEVALHELAREASRLALLDARRHFTSLDRP